MLSVSWSNHRWWWGLWIAWACSAVPQWHPSVHRQHSQRHRSAVGTPTLQPALRANPSCHWRATRQIMVFMIGNCAAPPFFFCFSGNPLWFLLLTWLLKQGGNDFVKARCSVNLFSWCFEPSQPHKVISGRLDWRNVLIQRMLKKFSWCILCVYKSNKPSYALILLGFLFITTHRL